MGKQRATDSDVPYAATKETTQVGGSILQLCVRCVGLLFIHHPSSTTKVSSPNKSLKRRDRLIGEKATNRWYAPFARLVTLREPSKPVHQYQSKHRRKFQPITFNATSVSETSINMRPRGIFLCRCFFFGN